MAGDTTLTIVGNLTADPELRFTPSGAAVVNFTVASTPRKYNSQTGQWEDQDALFMRCNAWRQMAENIAETFTRGSRVVAMGRLRQRSYEHDGQKRSVIEMEVEEVGPSLKFVSATINRPMRNEGGQQRQAPADDPWGSAPPATGRNDGFNDEPPF